MKKSIALFLAIILGCSAVLAASSRLYFHSIIYDEEVKQGQDNEFYITTEWDWQKATRTEIVERAVVVEQNCADPIITYVEEEVEVPVYQNPKELDDMQVVIFVPELGVMAMSLPYDQEQDDTVSQRISLDLEDAEPGEYVARITVSNDYTERVKHRIFVIE